MNKILFNFIIPSEIKEFCSVNKRRWKEFFDEGPSAQTINKGEPNILVDGFGTHPGYLMGIGVVANTLRKVIGGKCIWITWESSLNRKHRGIINSYWAESIYNIFIGFLFIDVLLCLKKTASIFRSINKPAEILDISINGIKVGDLIYDTYIRDTGSGTVDQLDMMLFRKILEAVFLCRIYERVIVKFKITHVVLGHRVYNRFGILARTAIKHGAIVYGKKGTDFFAVKKYTTLDELSFYELKIPLQFFEEIHKKHFNISRRVADKYLNDRTLGNIKGETLKIAYCGKSFASKEDMSNEFGLDIAKPFVFIMGHAFPDAPHNNDYYLFLDHYDWAHQTISQIKNIDGVNWILRDHPSNSRSFFHSKHSLVSIAKEIYGNSLPSNIAIMPDKQFSARTVIEMADGIVTGYGTIAIEASCFGVKSLLAGSSPFSGLGFTMDPKTKDEYFSLLQNVFLEGSDPPVDIDKARTAIFMYFVHLVPKSELIPEMSVFKFGTVEEVEGYAVASKILSSRKIEFDYGIQRLLEYFASNSTQFTNSFDFYDDKYFNADSD